MKTVPFLAKKLNEIYPASWIRRTGRRCRASVKRGKVDLVALFWTLILGPARGRCSTLAQLKLAFERESRISLVSSGFQKRFSSGLCKFLKCCVSLAMERSIPRRFALKLFEEFEDVQAIDSTIIKVPDVLEKLFPGPRTNTSPAAVKVNATYSVTSASLRRIRVRAGKTAETKFLRITKDIRGCLLLADLGYFRYATFGKIDRYGGFFISRLKANANPIIVADRCSGAGRSRNLVGTRFWDAVRGLFRDEVDVDVRVDYREKVRNKSANKKAVERSAVFRVVGVRNPATNEFHFYLTNLPTETMSPQNIRSAYTARWLVENVFDELKNSCRMASFPSKKRAVIEALIYASIIRIILGRIIRASILRNFEQGTPNGPLKDFTLCEAELRFTSKRFTIVWTELSYVLLADVLDAAGVTRGPLSYEMLLVHAAIDPNRHRMSLPRSIHAAFCDW